MKCLLIVTLVVVAVSCAYADDAGVFGSVLGAVDECSEKDVSLCLKEKALRFAEDISNKREINLMDGITLLGPGAPRSARSFLPLPDEARAREFQVDNRLSDITSEYLENGVLQLRVPNAVKDAIEEGRRRKNKRLQPLISLLQLKFTSLIPLFLGILVAVAVKALVIGKLAFLVNALVTLKKLLASKHEHAYELPAHPHHDEHYAPNNNHGWGRAAEEAQEMAYSAQSEANWKNYV